MRVTSTSTTLSMSVVNWILLFLIADLSIEARRGSCNGVSPFASFAIFSPSMSTPIIFIPLDARTAAVQSPTYPKPIKETDSDSRFIWIVLHQSSIHVVDVVCAQRQSERSNDRNRQHHVRRERFQDVFHRRRSDRPLEDEIVLRIPVWQAAQCVLAQADLLRRVLARPGSAPRATVQVAANWRLQIRLSRHPKHFVTMLSSPPPSTSGRGLG